MDAERLSAYQIPITAIREALIRQNADVPGGNVTAGWREESLRTMGRVVDPKAFNDLVITTIDGAPVRVRDIGRAEDGTKEQRSAARLNGVPTVTLEVRRQSGANTIAVIEAAKTNLERIATQLPPDVRLEVIRDQSRYIYAALRETHLHLGFGGRGRRERHLHRFVYGHLDRIQQVARQGSLRGRGGPASNKYNKYNEQRNKISRRQKYIRTPMQHHRRRRTEDTGAHSGLLRTSKPDFFCLVSYVV